MNLKTVVFALSLGLGVWSLGQPPLAQACPPPENRPEATTWMTDSAMTNPTPTPAENTPNAQSPSLGDRLLNTRWLLEDLGGRGVVDRVQTTLEFGENGRIGGQAGCNRYFSQAAIEGDRFSVGGVGSTRMACPPAIMDQERRFLGALQSANRIELDGPYLLVYFEASDQPLKFSQLGSPTE